MTPIIMIIAFSVFGLTTIGAVNNSAKDTFLKAFDLFRFVTIVEPRNAKDMPTLPANIINDIQADQRVDDIYPSVNFYVKLSLLANTSAFLSSDILVLGVSEEHARELLALTGSRVVAGRLPTDGQNEVALAAEIAQNGGLKLGDTFTSSDTRTEKKFVLVGILEGRVPLGLASYTYMRTKSELFGYPQGVIVIPTSQEQLSSLSQSLKDILDSRRIRILDYKFVSRYIHTMMQSTGLVLGLVILVVAIVISIQTALLNTIYLNQRISEYALLNAIGHQKSYLLYRMLKELLFTSLIGWGIGVLLVYGGLHWLKGFFNLRGIALNPLAPQAYLSTLSVPVLLVLSSIVAMRRNLFHLDPIRIVERRVE